MRRIRVARCPGIALAAGVVVLPISAAAQPAGPTESEVVITEAPTFGMEGALAPHLYESGPPPLAPEAAQQWLGAWLDAAARNARQTRRFVGVNEVIGSSAGMGVGIWAFIESDRGTELNKGLGLALVAVSGVTLGLGIFQLARQSDAEKRLERWRKAEVAGVTPQELARFEGELRSQSAGQERALLMLRWMNLGIGLTGGLILGLTPAANLSSEAATVSYVIGGTTAGLGFFGFVMSFLRPAPIDYWSTYQQGSSSAGGRRWSAVPAVGRRFVGAQVVGRF